MPHPMPRAGAPIALLLLLTAALAGCGAEGTVREDSSALRITLDEYRITPQDVSVRPGRLKFIVRNSGRLTHNLVVQIPPRKRNAPYLEVGRVDTAQPGESPPPIKLRLETGTYRMVCTIGNHDDLGQYGTLKVQE